MGVLKQATDEFEASHRPWLAIRDMQIRGPIIFLNENMIIPVQFKIENTGSTPATDFIMFGEGLSQTSQFSIPNKLSILAINFGQLKTPNISGSSGRGSRHLSVGRR
jgi:hypothetical protein